MFFRRNVEQCLQAEYLEARHALLVAEAEAEVYEHGHKTALLRVEMLTRRLARLYAQIERDKA